MAVDYNDERLKNVEKEQDKAIQETTNTYNQMINDSNKYYQAQVDAVKDYEKTQTQLQKDQTQFAIDKIEQQKEQAQKDYQREQRGAYSDYQKATNQYGVNAEMQAMQGLNRAGYSESTRTNAYNTYQNRYATARESYNNAVQNYDNGIREAQLANNATLAQIAYNSLQQQLGLALEGFQYKNTLIQTRMNAVNQEKDRYNTRYQQVLSQINTENALAEQQRQYNESMAWQREQAALAAARSSGGGYDGYGGYGGLVEDNYVVSDSTGTALPVAGALAGASGQGTKSTNLGSSYTKILNTLTSSKLISNSQKEKILGNAIAKGELTEAGAKKIIEKLNK